MVDTTSLVIACGDQVYEQHLPLFTDKERVEGCTVQFARLGPGEMLFRSFEEPAFNVAELSLSNFVSLTAATTCPYVAIPVYVKRVFVHADFYVRTDRSIATAQDLAGRRIGIAEYQHTAYVWARGLLQQEYGVHPSSVSWVSVGVGPQRDVGGPEFAPPADVHVEHVTGGPTLSEMLERGDIDALISPRVPDCYQRKVPSVSRLFRDYRSLEREYLAHTGVFPILHVMGVRRELIGKNPDIAVNLFKAFSAARHGQELTGGGNNSAATSSAQADKVASKGHDNAEHDSSYGLQPHNRATLFQFLKYHFEQGLSARPLSVEELFFPVAVSQYGS